MKQLLLMRHGKAKRGEIIDFERPLMKRGKRDVSRVGIWLRRKTIIPDLVLCSPSQRTFETWNVLQRQLSSVAEPRLLKSLYGAGSEELLSCIRAVSAEVHTLMVIGHNPGLQELVYRLAGPGSTLRVAKAIAAKFPTAAVAIFEAEIHAWRELGESTARIVRIVHPAEIK